MTFKVNIQLLFRQSFVEPKTAAKQFLALDLSYDAIFSLFLASVCASTVLIFGFDIVFYGADARVGLLGSPWQFAAIVAVLTLATAIGIAWIGQKLSGQGSFRLVMALIAWLQVVQLGMQVVSYFTLILPTLLVTFLQFGLIGWSFWIFIAFIDEVHKFDNMMKSALVAFLGTMVGMLGLFFMISLFGIFGGGGNGI
ncbi:MAG: YIP1 family protein [Paracoccaceae bacterium]